jgi:hypothetical protein
VSSPISCDGRRRACRYVEKVDPALLDTIDRIVATVYRLVHR